jgi:hypothetical protein
MRRIVMALICISVATGLSTAATASAALPELGRCVKVVPKTGEYVGGRCESPAGGKGGWSFIPGPGEKKTFTATIESAVLKGTGAHKTSISCAFGEASGEYTGPKTLTVKTLTLFACEQAGAFKTADEKFCQNVLSELGEIKGNELSGEIGFIEPTKVGVDLKAASGTALALFECGGANSVTEKGTGLGTIIEVTGSVVGRLKKINVMTTENVLTHTVKNGVQMPEQLEGGPKDTLTLNVGTAKTAEPATYKDFDEVINAEALEVKAR